MAKLKLSAGFDAEGLDQAEYDDSFEPYTGPLPPNNTILKFRLVRAWACESGNGDFMIKVMNIAEDSGEYNRLAVVDQVVFKETAAFRYQPWLAAMGLTAKRIKQQTEVEEDADEKWGGPQILSVGSWKPGSDDAVCFIRVVLEEYNGEMRPRAGKYISVNDDAVEGYEPPAAGKGTPQPPRQAKPAQAPEGADDDSLFGDEPPF
jgi:hypothetical protein